MLQTEIISYRPSVWEYSQKKERTEGLSLRASLIPHFETGARSFIEDNNLNYDTSPSTLRMFYLAAATTRYNAVYFMSRLEAKEHVPFVVENSEAIDEIGKVINQTDRGALIINTMVQEGLHGFEKGGTVVVPATKCVPGSFQTWGEGTIAYKEKDFSSKSPKQKYDLHDFAHLLAASASDGHFSAKYQEGLHDLPKRYIDLTYSKGYKDLTGFPFSDAALLTQFSLPLFDAYNNQGLPDDVIVDKTARGLCSFLKGEQALYHPSTNRIVKLEELPTMKDIAVLMQNKRYERGGAEVERSLFVRGTPEGERGDPSRDPLYDMTNSERIIYIASNPQGLYFEARNLYRNRAQEKAYELYTSHLLSMDITQGNRDLGHDILRFTRLHDLRDGKPLNLYKQVRKALDEE